MQDPIFFFQHFLNVNRKKRFHLFKPILPPAMNSPIQPSTQTPKTHHNIVTTTTTDHDDDFVITDPQYSSKDPKNQPPNPDLEIFRQFQRFLKNREPSPKFPDNQGKDNVEAFHHFQQFQSFLAFQHNDAKGNETFTSRHLDLEDSDDSLSYCQ